MRIKILTDNIDSSESLQEMIDEKLASGLDELLTNYEEEIKEATVHVEKRTRWGYKVNFDMWLPGKKHIFAEETGDELLNVVVALREKLETQIREYTDKVQGNW